VAVLVLGAAAGGVYALAVQARGQGQGQVAGQPPEAERALMLPRQGVKVDNHTLAVVPVYTGIEAVVVLDPSAVTLTGYILNRHTGKFFARYYYNRLAADFGLAAVQDPQFSIIGGTTDFNSFGSHTRLADAAVYVAEHSTGKVAAYGLPYNPTYYLDPPAVAQYAFIPLDAANFRFPAFRQVVPQE
jgi:hypothetical protein